MNIAGLQVIVIDNDQRSLLLLETLLRKCDYQVTTTTSAIIALKLLKENKNEFDFVISEVNTVDMDGFQLIEIMGLEMGLPVIMLSANDDPKMVMKGISNGACYYLPKPARIEELQIIWQHVIRKKIPKSYQCSGNITRSLDLAENKLNKKRKRKNEDDAEGNENKDPMLKKPRVSWTDELHHKFLLAVNQLGIHKAVPRKIVELMNVKNLTKENVASHLQKYRLRLKKIKEEASEHEAIQQACYSTDSWDFNFVNDDWSIDYIWES